MGLFKRKPAEPTPSQANDSAAAASPDNVAFIKPAPSEFAPGTGIGYHPDLIERFESTHAALQKLFEAIKTHATRDEFSEAQKSLQAFRKTLTGHLLEENIKLYTYLSKCMAADPDNKELIDNMKAEMGQIGTTVMHFIKEYTNSGITPFNKKQFLSELDEIGTVLVDRIEREESSLYTMYMPPSAFQ